MMPSTLPAPDYAALVKAIDATCGACTCGPLTRLGMAPRCYSCCQKIALLADILASTDTHGMAAIVRWMDFRACPEVLRLGEPKQ